MFVIVLTGGLGAGKSVAARFLGSRGATVLDLDVLAKELLRPGSEAYDRIIEQFGDEVVGDDGTMIDMARLAGAAFSSPKAASRLNQAVHPPLRREVTSLLEGLQRMDRPPAVVVLEVPLLVEAPAFAEFGDVVLAIEAPESVRVARAVAFGRAECDARARIACQAPDGARAALADRVIVNDSSIKDFERELERFWDEVVAPSAT